MASEVPLGEVPSNNSAGLLEEEVPSNNSAGNGEAPVQFFRLDDQSHVLELCVSLNELHKRNVGHDITIQVGTRTFHAHKIVLAANSEYFERMFYGEMEEAKKDSVRLEGIDSCAFACIVVYCYTGRVKFNPSKAKCLVSAADMLQFPVVKKACSTFMSKQTTSSNCLEMFRFAVFNRLEELKVVAGYLVRASFLKSARQGVFLDFTFEEFDSLLDGESMGIFSELDVFDAIVQWCNHNHSERKGHFSALIKHVRLRDLPQKVLVDYVECSLFVKEDLENRHFLHEMRNSWATEAAHFGDQPKECRALLAGTELYAIGGVETTGVYLNSTEKYLAEGKCWTNTTPMNIQRAIPHACCYQNKIYVLGGYSANRKVLPTMEMFDCDKETWTPVRSLASARSAVGFCEADGWLYAVSGKLTNGVATPSTEQYDPVRDSWSTASQMLTARESAVVVSYNGSLYAFGGINQQNKVRTCERYDPRMGIWCGFAESPENRHFSLVNGHAGVMDNKAYLFASPVGGPSGEQNEPTVCTFDFRFNKWENAFSLSGQPKYGGAVCFNGELVMMGGNQNAAVVSTGTSFQKGSDAKWTKRTFPSMGTARRAFCIVAR